VRFFEWYAADDNVATVLSVYQGAGTLQQKSALACVDPLGFLASFCQMGFGERELDFAEFHSRRRGMFGGAVGKKKERLVLCFYRSIRRSRRR
jgi:hypothetical protein